jgi:hypothetical protein
MMPHATDMSQMCKCITVLIIYVYVYLQVKFTASDLKILILDPKEREKLNIVHSQVEYTRELCQSLLKLGSVHFGLSLRCRKVPLGTI